MPRLPSISTLRAFEAAARLRSFSKAGVELGLTHGAISHRIRALEEEVGERLFSRSGNRMEPTSASGRYLASVRQALELLSAAFATASTASVRTLRIAVLPSFASHWLVPRLKDFHDTHPDLQVALDARLDVVQLGAGGADAAIRHGHGDWPNTHSRPLVGERLFPVCSPSYRAQMRIDAPADLRRCRLLRHGWTPWTPWFAAAGLDWPEPNDSAVFEDAGLLIDAALAGGGVLLGRTVLVADALATGGLVRLSDVEIPFEGAYHFVTPGDGDRAGQVGVFGDWLSETLRAEFGA